MADHLPTNPIIDRPPRHLTTPLDEPQANVPISHKPGVVQSLRVWAATSMGSDTGWWIRRVANPNQALPCRFSFPVPETTPICTGRVFNIDANQNNFLNRFHFMGHLCNGSARQATQYKGNASLLPGKWADEPRITRTLWKIQSLSAFVDS